MYNIILYIDIIHQNFIFVKKIKGYIYYSLIPLRVASVSFFHIIQSPRRQVWTQRSDRCISCPSQFPWPCYPRPPSGLISSILVRDWLPTTFTRHSEFVKHFINNNNLLIRCIWATRTAALSYSRFLDITTKPDCGCFQKLCPTVTNQGAIGFGTAVNYAFYCSGDKSIPYMAKVEVPGLNLANSRSSVCITTQPRVQLPKRIRRGFTCSLYDQPRPESHPTPPSYVE